jgi:hypothetical protein
VSGTNERSKYILESVQVSKNDFGLAKFKANRSFSQISTKVDPSAMGNLALFLRSTRMNKVCGANGCKLNFDNRCCDNTKKEEAPAPMLNTLNTGNPLLS